MNVYNMGWNVAQAHQNVVGVWGKEAIAQCTINRWLAKFHSSDRSLQEEEGQGQQWS